MNPHGIHFFNRENALCNICGTKPWFWLPRGHSERVLNILQVIGGGRRWVDCPRCGSSDRDRLIFYAIHEFIPLKHGSKILHIAPETPIWNRWNREHYEVYGLDKRTRGYSWSYDNRVVRGDLERLKHPDDFFDLLIANHVLEHIHNEAAALKEIHRVLKPGGWALLQVPFSPKKIKPIELPLHASSKQRRKELGQFDHARLYGANPWFNWLKYGFEHIPLEVDVEIRSKFKIHPVEPLMAIRKTG